MLEWLVIGGGPHGVHAAARLIGDAEIPRERVRILDDESELLARWRRCTRNTGMRFLRSPAVHHLDLSSASLQRFAKSGKGNRFDRPFARPYSRPSLEVFDRHSESVIERLGLDELHVRGRANALEISESGVRVGFEREASRGDHGEIEAKHVVLALGAPAVPAWPEWASTAVGEAAARDRRARVEHVFDPGFELVDQPQDEIVAVVGAGISGAQVALRLAKEGRRVLLFSRSPLREHQFDSDPGWQGPKYMAGFDQLRDPNVRRERIREARHRGSVPPDVHSALRGAIKNGLIDHRADVEVRALSIGERRMSLCFDDTEVDVDRVLLATGFPSHRPGGEWLDEAIAAYGLPCADCGYPIVDRGLRWHPRVLVTGPLAELEIGPVSRNLSGAMRAGERIAAVARADWVY